MPVRQQVGRSHAFVANDPNQPIPHSFWELRRPLYGEICVSFLVYTHKRSTWQKNWSRWVTQHTIQSVWWVCYLKKRSGQLAARLFFWCYVKSFVYANKATWLEKLWPNIVHEIAVVIDEKFEQVVENGVQLTLSSSIHKCFDCTLSQ